MAGMGWREVWSEAVQAVAHDPETGEFRVKWRSGKISVYGGVDAGMADEIARSPSVGSALWLLRRRGHEHRYEEEK